MNVIQQLNTMVSELRGTPYTVKLGKMPELVRDIKCACYTASTDLSNPIARDVVSELEENKWCDHDAADLDQLVYLLEQLPTPTT